MTNNEEFADEIGNNHIATNEQAPLRKDAFEKTDEEKIELIKNEQQRRLCRRNWKQPYCN